MSRLRGWRAGLIGALVCATVLGVVGLWKSAGSDFVSAADTRAFQPGNIIADDVFFDGSAMNATQIQSFLDAKGSSCQGGSDAPCLKNYRQSTTSQAADSYCPRGYAGAADEPAATIIAKVGVACGISPKVLLVTLQKETGLVTRTTPTAHLYDRAMGYGCADSMNGACSAYYPGFANQVYFAAKQFKRYAANPKGYSYRAGITNNIQYSVNAGCGTAAVLIQNQATAGLYNYTPYVPNAAALAAGYGVSSDPCAQYGNRNFWMYFTDWFGSTQDRGESAWQPFGSLETVSAQTGSRIGVTGWAVDPDSSGPIVVRVYVDGAYSAPAVASLSRPDLAGTLGPFGAGHGFSVAISVAPGTHDVCVYGVNVGAPTVNPKLGCSTVDTSHLPLGRIEFAGVQEGQALLTGWAFDPDATTPIAVHVYVNGVLRGYGTANGSRPDVGAVYPGAGDSHGFVLGANLSPGDNQVCAYGINVPMPGNNPMLECRTIHLDVVPRGRVDHVGGGADSISVDGWALDPETSSPIDVQVTMDGGAPVAYPAGASRPDVAAAYPGTGDRHGYALTIPADPGDHRVCLTAMNAKQGTTNTSLGCSTVNVGLPPRGHLDGVSVTAFQAVAHGWGLDPDTTNPIGVRITVDGKPATTVSASATRVDIAAAFPASGSAHGFATPLSLSAGRHLICAEAPNVLGGSGDAGLGCFSVPVATGQSLPFGHLDAVWVQNGFMHASGWVVEPDAPTAPVAVHFYVDGRLAGYLTATASRPDVAAAYPGVGPAHGYEGVLRLSPGRHTLCTYGINQGAGRINPQLGCRVITVP